MKLNAMPFHRTQQFSGDPPSRNGTTHSARRSHGPALPEPQRCRHIRIRSSPADHGHVPGRRFNCRTRCQNRTPPSLSNGKSPARRGDEPVAMRIFSPCSRMSWFRHRRLPVLSHVTPGSSSLINELETDIPIGMLIAQPPCCRAKAVPDVFLVKEKIGHSSRQAQRDRRREDTSRRFPTGPISSLAESLAR